ncbi:MAG: KEOPS complex subunit Pcc1 [Candidatus ainarchaeum sp.]|nr:KEOPS complex subunit Pcc1 [Candidatus ainarchaeum sp.]
MRLNLKIKIDFETKEKASIFFKSIKPELEEKFERSEIKIFQNKNILKIEIIAVDKTAARASLNSIMKPLKLFNELDKLKGV